jgi:hypothetical protein
VINESIEVKGKKVGSVFPPRERRLFDTQSLVTITFLQDMTALFHATSFYFPRHMSDFYILKLQY